MAYTYPTECDEVAATISIEGVKTFADAVAAVTRMMGTPAEVGYQIHDNIAESLWVRTRAKTAPELAATTHANLRAQVAAEIEHADSFQPAPKPGATRYIVREDGDANFYGIRWGKEGEPDSRWIMRVQLNGEMMPAKQEALMQRIADLLNQHGEG